MFERNAVTGRLDHVQLLETDFDLVTAALLWDPHRARLLATACGTWWSFARNGDGPPLENLGELTAGQDPGACAEHREHLLLDADGSNVYRVRRSRIDHFAVEDEGVLQFVNSTYFGGFLRAVLSNDGRRVYAMTSNNLLVFERDAESGALVRTDFEEEIQAPYTPPLPLAITDDDGYLFVFDGDGGQANLFALEDPLNPNLVATFSQYLDPYQLNSCRFADARNEAVAVDVFCPGMAFAVRWDAEAGQLELTDSLVEGEPDRFNALTPNFGAPNFGAPAGFAVSPDDRYVYLSTPQHGIVVLGRGSPPGDGGGPDLGVGSPSVDNAGPASGATFTLSVTVHNQGNGESAATTLRFYRSADASITRDDTEVGSASVPDIPASGTSDHSSELTAPTDPGTYYYGACVDDVASESDVENNCSAAATITVRDDEDSYCRDGDTLQPDGECDIYDTTFSFDVSASGTGCIRAGGMNLCSTGTHGYRNSTFNGVTVTFVAQRDDDDSWAIVDVEPEPPD